MLQFILDRHKPYAAVVLDRYSNCLLGNSASDRLLAAIVDADLITEHADQLRLAFILAGHGVHHRSGRRRAASPGAGGAGIGSRAGRCRGLGLARELRAYAGPLLGQRPPARLGANDLLLPVHVRKDGVELRLFGAIMTLGTPPDVTLQELRIETSSRGCGI